MERLGYIRLWRKTLDSMVHSDAVVLAVWVSLLLRANWKTSWFRGVKLDPGQVVVSQETLAKELGLGRQKVRRALGVLEKSGNINQRTNQRVSVVTICNWSRYQAEQDDVNQSDNHLTTNDQPPANHSPTRSKEEEESKELQEARLRSKNRFSRFWESYPRRDGKRAGKAKAEAKFVKFSEADQEAAILAAGHYADSRQARDGFARDAHRFLAADEWRVWLQPEDSGDPAWKEFLVRIGEK